MFGVRKPPTGCNFVHNDEIWKDHVRRELQMSRKWPNSWGFLAVHYRTQARRSKLAPAPQLHFLQPRKFPIRLPPIQPPQHSTIADLRATEDGAHYPRTTAGEVGWKGMHITQLEKFGRHKHGRKGIRQLLQWPRESIF